MNADLIVVVEKGKIVEMGPHEKLIAQGGRYADLWSKQAFLQPHKYRDGDDEANSTEIVNDLPKRKTTAEISKLKKAKTSATGGGKAQAMD